MIAPPGNEDTRPTVDAGDGLAGGESGDNQPEESEADFHSERKPNDTPEDAGTPPGNGDEERFEDSPRSSSPTIPANVNELYRMAAAQLYSAELGWAIHPLYASDRGHEKERGKKPLLKGWRNHIAADITPDFLTKYFGPGTNNNIGCVVRPPFIHVDLDSKPNAGASVMEWLATQPELATVPRERTGGGAHLAFICRDIPEEVMKLKKPPTCQINDKVSAELYLNGMNLVLSPSVHKSGHRYKWEVTGVIPEVTWANLFRWFGFATPEPKKPGRHAKEKPWWTKWQEDLRTLDIVNVMRDLNHLGECIDPDGFKWAVSCPWEDEHGGGPANVPGSDTIIFNRPSVLPAFRCLHSHCEARGLKDLLEWAERRKPGIIAANCTARRVWSQGQNDAHGRLRILLPGPGRAASDFCREVGANIGPREVWFLKGEIVCSVGMKAVTDKITTLVFSPVQPLEAVTSVETFIEIGVLKGDQGDLEFQSKSMLREDAAILLASPQFKEQLPKISRILDVCLPIACGGDILFPKPGYDHRFRTYCPPDAPVPVPMGLDRALAVLRDVHAEFCWKSDQSVTHAIARMITPYCRGLMGWDARLPLWYFGANRPRAGKDCLAGSTQILYEGRTCEDSPIGKDSEETRKRITAALMSGRRSMHFANCQEYLQDQHLIGAVTSRTFAARNLGSTDAKADLVLANELEFSLSANVGLAYREDLEPRIRRIDLEFLEEDANGRSFHRPDLHGWILTNRSLVLGAVAAIVQHWIDCGCPAGATPFNSFPEWARVVGGIMTCCGLGDPCLPHESAPAIGGDGQERALRAIYRLGYAKHPDKWITKPQLFELLDAAPDSDTEALTSFAVNGDLTSREARMRIGRALRKFNGRHLNGIQMLMDDNAKSQRQLVIFKQPSPTVKIDLDRIFGPADSTRGSAAGQSAASGPTTDTGHSGHSGHFQHEP